MFFIALAELKFTKPKTENGPLISCSQTTYPHPLGPDHFFNLLHVRKFLVSLPLTVQIPSFHLCYFNVSRSLPDAIMFASVSRL